MGSSRRSAPRFERPPSSGRAAGDSHGGTERTEAI
jgi:hypothetical protein